jgi:hypothetical protein
VKVCISKANQRIDVVDGGVLVVDVEHRESEGGRARSGEVGQLAIADFNLKQWLSCM